MSHAIAIEKAEGNYSAYVGLRRDVSGGHAGRVIGCLRVHTLKLVRLCPLARTLCVAII